MGRGASAFLISAAGAAGLALFAAASVSADQSGLIEPPQGGLHRRTPGALKSHTRVEIRVTNRTGSPVELVWVNSSGDRRSYGVLPPQGTRDAPAVVGSYAGHVWLFKSRGSVRQTYVVTSEFRQQIVLGQNATNGASQLPPAVASGSREPFFRSLVTSNNGDRVPGEAVEFLRVHNAARARVGAPPLRWSAALAHHAQEWADQLAFSGQFRHRLSSGSGYGENLFSGQGDYSPADAARYWVQEKAAYRGEPITPDNLPAVGHYTQIVWSSTTEVGCGVARGRKGIVVVANYAPGGNYFGRRPY